MREIKFRVWCKDHSEWEKDPILIDLDGNLLHAHRFPPMRIRPDNHILMQYTGLKDKNGREIYEGDIVVWRALIWEIRWSNNSMHFYLLSREKDIQQDETLLNDHDLKQSEIIGNIYENP